MLALYQTHDLPVECCEAVKPAVLQKWLGHTQTPQEVQMDIVWQMEREITGGEKQTLPFITETERFSSTTDGP